MHSAHRLYEAKCIGHISGRAHIVNAMFDLDRFIAERRHLDMDRETGAFCTPLFYRLNLIHINLIPRPVESRAEAQLSH